MTSSYVSISEALAEDTFDISFTIVQRGISPGTGSLPITSFELFPSPFTMPCEELIRDVPRFLRSNAADYLSQHDFESLASKIISYYQEIIQRASIPPSLTLTHHRFIPLIVYLHVSTSDDDDHGIVPFSFHLQTTALYADNEYMTYIDDDDETYHSIEQSMQQHYDDHQSTFLSGDHYHRHMSDDEEEDDDDDESAEIYQVIEQSIEHLFIVPATQEAIMSLKKLMMSSDEAKGSQCSICLENFDDNVDEDDDFLALPCDHFFHSDCIVKWLKTGHTCPLCRFELAVD
ncbi:E3 ubiquitin ligase BIG BROTHER-related-like [Neltuma alba]|uniref:E3 ubiquitin ligase BIG BROTHER-related-like n=1 Tax=Neltuma alba TaxID=207710 RepID=UPI0010A4A852|nr:E3 ubiquitin ligase BIG BROTHER-related-like [Prosopis alba]